MVKSAIKTETAEAKFKKAEDKYKNARSRSGSVEIPKDPKITLLKTKAEAAQSKWILHAIPIFDDLQKMEERRLDFLSSLMVEYISFDYQCYHEDAESYDSVLPGAVSFDGREDIALFCSENTKSISASPNADDNNNLSNTTNTSVVGVKDRMIILH